TPGRCTNSEPGWILHLSARPNNRVGSSLRGPCSLLLARVPGCWRLDELRTKPRGRISPSWHLYRENSQRRQACRPAGPATDQVRAGHQHQDREDARPRRTLVPPTARRRGDRIRILFCCGEPAPGTSRTWRSDGGILPLSQQVRTSCRGCDVSL